MFYTSRLYSKFRLYFGRNIELPTNVKRANHRSISTHSGEGQKSSIELMQKLRSLPITRTATRDSCRSSPASCFLPVAVPVSSPHYKKLATRFWSLTFHQEHSWVESFSVSCCTTRMRRQNWPRKKIRIITLYSSKNKKPREFKILD